LRRDNNTFTSWELSCGGLFNEFSVAFDLLLCTVTRRTTTIKRFDGFCCGLQIAYAPLEIEFRIARALSMAEPFMCKYAMLAEGVERLRLFMLAHRSSIKCSISI